jgi:hypothetical protein
LSGFLVQHYGATRGHIFDQGVGEAGNPPKFGIAQVPKDLVNIFNSGTIEQRLVGAVLFKRFYCVLQLARCPNVVLVAECEVAAIAVSSLE